jgi:hypothetical protein
MQLIPPQDKKVVALVRKFNQIALGILSSRIGSGELHVWRVEVNLSNLNPTGSGDHLGGLP